MFALRIVVSVTNKVKAHLHQTEPSTRLRFTMTRQDAMPAPERCPGQTCAFAKVMAHGRLWWKVFRTLALLGSAWRVIIGIGMRANRR